MTQQHAVPPEDATAPVSHLRLSALPARPAGLHQATDERSSDRDVALAAACCHAVSGATLLVVVDATHDEDAARLGERLGRSVVTKWADATSTGRADHTGITVATQDPVHVSWTEVAAVILRGLTPPRKAQLEALSAQVNRRDAHRPDHPRGLALVRDELEQLRVAVLASGLPATPDLRSQLARTAVHADALQR